MHSSNVAAWRYDAAAKRLELRFVSGGVYAYSGVPATVARSFAGSPSPGRYVHAVLKLFPASKIG